MVDLVLNNTAGDVPDLGAMSVSMLNQRVKSLLEDTFADVYVCGEISNLIRASSGHVYFSLKDSQSQVRCAFFKGSQRAIHRRLIDGDEVVVFGRVSLYTQRGDYQLIVQRLDYSGSGALRQRFEKIKKKLQDEGLFAKENKKRLPEIPRVIGVVTSSHGAAIRDVLKVLKRRWPLAQVIIYPSLVQGSHAAAALCQALTDVESRQECDVVILTRGGGSLEDLWPFNEESVARAVYACTIPIVTGIGHEVDITLCDGVADVRAATPSAAAELVVPDQLSIGIQLSSILNRIEVAMYSSMKAKCESLTQVSCLLLKSMASLDMLNQQLDFMDLQLRRLWDVTKSHLQGTLSDILIKMQYVHPSSFCHRSQQECNRLYFCLTRQIDNCIAQSHEMVCMLSASLHSLSPLDVLSRGYSFVSHKTKGVISSISSLDKEDVLSLNLQDGIADVEVRDITQHEHE